jgi:peptidyl-tRNA hydrolase
VTTYLMSDISSKEKHAMSNVVVKVHGALTYIVRDGRDVAMNIVNAHT